MLMLWSICVMAHAQSMYLAKHYYENKRYLEAAKQLRPLADGGDAEAQYMAAELFYYGLGVQKNEAQSNKYLTLAADQGYDKAMDLLVTRLAKKGDKRAYSFAKKYIERHPYLEKGTVGRIMGGCLVEGECGAPKDEDAGWKILEKNNEFNEWLKDFNKASRYWEYKAEKAGKKSIDELAEYYHWLGFIDKFNKVDSCLQWLYDTNEKLTARADSGSAWAMNQLAIQYNKKGDKATALSWARKASNAGSARGRAMENRLSYVPVTCSKISIGSQADRRYSIESIVLDYDRITINFVFQTGYSTWIATAEKTYIQYGDKYYKILKSTLPIYPQTRSLQGIKVFRFSYTFYRKPNDIPTFNIIENGKTIYQNVQILDKPTIVSSTPRANASQQKPSVADENKCYFYQNGKKMLISLGIIDNRGQYLFSGQKAKPYANILDKKITKKITVYGKTAKLITTHPSGSYDLFRRTKHSAELVINDPAAFWSVSDIAIILNDW